MLKLLLDENIGLKVAKSLREVESLDVKSVIESDRGASDKGVLKIAQKEKRIVVTLDKDFCQLVFLREYSCEGVVLLRLKNESPEKITEVLLTLLGSWREELIGSFTVIDEEKVRFRKLK